MRNTTVAIGVGSNLNTPIENLRKALLYLKNSKILQVQNVSSIYESDAQMPDDADEKWNKKFLNAVVLCSCAENATPSELLRELKAIEKKIGRTDSEKWAPRIIDLDILFWSRDQFSDNLLTIPHKHLLNRPFAYLPLLEVWPEIKTELKISIWSETQPFNTVRSKNYFWPKMVGILNITEDSFSDGGKFLNEENLVVQVQKMRRDGAEILDLGAESTRPGSISVDEKTEFKNLSWALKIIEPFKMKISLDSRNPNVVAQILNQYEIDFLNDVTGFQSQKMKMLLKEFKKKAFLMHSLSIPPDNSNILDVKFNPNVQLVNWWKNKLIDLSEFGIDSENLIFDPGIGFGKTKQQNLYILENLNELSEVKNEIMLGYSRKSFLSLFSDRPAKERDLETALITKQINLVYTQYLRVHDIETQNVALRSRS